MKLRNKKTGAMIELELIQINDEYLNDHELETMFGEPITLEVLNKYYEDYKPKEPLIKDEKIRKAVKTWAAANDVLEVFADCIGDGTYMELYDEDDGRRRISALRPAGLKTGEAYNIAELCGEEDA